MLNKNQSCIIYAALEKTLNENNAQENDRNQDIPEYIKSKLIKNGCFGLLIPQEYGGKGLSSVQFNEVCSKLGYNDLALATFLGTHSSVGSKGLLLHGNEEQKKKYLPKISSGEMITSFCLSEPDAGSDLHSIKSNVVEDSKGNFILNGQKIWISNGGYADLFTVFAKHNGKISSFIVEKKFGGIKISNKLNTMGIKASNTTNVSFVDTLIPRSNLLGQEGSGLEISKNVLTFGRNSLAAACSGMILKALNEVLKQTSERVQFSRQIYKFEAIQERIAEIKAMHYASECLSWHVANILDSENQDSEITYMSAMSKVLASEFAWKVMDESLQLFGGRGYMEECEISRMLRDARILKIYEGTNGILKLMIAKKIFKNIISNQKGSFERLKYSLISKEPCQSKMNDNIHQFKVLLCSHLAHFAHPLAQTIAKFEASCVNLVHQHDKELYQRQSVLERTSQIAINLYSILVCLARCNDNIKVNSQNSVSGNRLEFDIVEFYVNKTIVETNQLIDMINDNQFIFTKVSDIVENLINEKQKI